MLAINVFVSFVYKQYKILVILRQACVQERAKHGVLNAGLLLPDTSR